MKCPNCKAKMPNDALYCSECGYPLRQRTCPVCHAPVAPDSRFCGACGAALNAARSTEPAVGQAAAEQEQTEKEKKPKKSKTPKEHKGKKFPVKKALIAVLALVIVVAGGVGLLLSGVLTPSKKVSAVSEYVIQYDNGDTVYSQGDENLAIDEDTYLIYYDNLLIVFTLTNLSDAEAEALADEVGGTVVGDISGCINMLQILVPSTDLETLNTYADTLMASDDVLYASYDIPMTIDATDDNPWSDDGTIIEDKGNESDPDGNDWWAEAIGAYTAWEIVDSLPNALSDITIGIVDSGFDTDHEDLAGKITVLNENSEADHGTHVAGIIGAANNDIGIRGIADIATLLAVDCEQTTTADDGSTITVNLITTGEWIELTKLLVEQGVKVINNSWGSALLIDAKETDDYYDAFYDLFGDYRDNDLARDAYEVIVENKAQETARLTIVMMYELYINGYLGSDSDVLFVQSAGNGYEDSNGNSVLGSDAADATGYYCAITEERFEASIPAISMTVDMDTGLVIRGYDDSFNYEFVKDHILIVGAVSNSVTEDGAYEMISRYSYGDTVDICAPGGEIYSTITNDRYDSKSGTSMAAPMVSASAALVWSLNPDLTAGEVKSILISTAGRAVGTADEDAGNEYPMLNVGSAVIQTVMGTITGTVVDGETGETLTGVTCTLTTDATDNEFFTTPTISSADDGSFTVSAIGNCTVTLEKDGYEAVEFTVDVNLREDVDVGEITMSPSSNEGVLRAKLDELIETYGTFASGQSGTATWSSGVTSWLDPSGILSATILDLDADGALELLVCRTDPWTYRWKSGDTSTYYKVLMEVYESDGNMVTLADSLWCEPYSYNREEDSAYVHSYVALTEAENCEGFLTINAVQVESGYYLVCEHTTIAVLGDGGYATTWMLEYQNGTLQYVCSLDDEWGGTDGVSYAYDFENGVNTKATLYCHSWTDLSDYKGTYNNLEVLADNEMLTTLKTSFFASYGLSFTPMGSYYCRFSGTTSSDSNIEQVFDLTISATTNDYSTYLLEETLSRGNDLLR